MINGVSNDDEVNDEPFDGGDPEGPPSLPEISRTDEEPVPEPVAPDSEETEPSVTPGSED